MSTQDKREWIRDQYFRVGLAQDVLLAAKRQLVSDFDARSRRLKEISQMLKVKTKDTQQFELFEPEAALSESDELLIQDPTRGIV